MAFRDRSRRLAGEAGKTARAAVDWWASELSASLPPRLAAWLLDRKKPLTLKVAATGASVMETDGSLLARLTADDDWPEALADRAAEPVVIELPRASVLLRTVELPLAAAQELDAALAFEIDRQTPFPAGEVLHAGRVVALDSGRGVLRAELAVAPRRLTTAALARAERWGLRVAALRIMDEAGSAFDLPIAGLSRGHGHREIEPWKLLCLASFLLLAAGLAILSWRAQVNARALEGQVAAKQEAGKRAEAIKAKVAAAEKQAVFFAEKRADPSPIALLAELSERLPDDSFVTTLTLAGRTLRVEGATGSAPALIETLQQGKTFGEPRLAAVQSQDTVDGKERFDLTLTLRRSPP